jgi:hypothetical protein
MIWHPLSVSVLTMDLLGVLCVAAAVLSAIRIVAGWSPELTKEGRIDLTRKAVTASIQGRIGFALMLLSTLVLVAGITGVFPKLVPGAMCGTGVLQATKGAAGRALALRGLALGLLAVWHLLDRLDRRQPDSPLAVAAARSLLVATPVAVLAAYDTMQAILRLDVNRPVDCCSVVYGKIESAGRVGTLSGVPDAYWIWGLALGGIAVILFGAHLWRSTCPPGTRKTGLAVLLTSLWVPVAATGLIRSLAAYLHGLPQHRCPWCLFLPKHSLIGYLLFGCLILGAVEAGAAFVSVMVAARFPALEPEAIKRSRTAGWRLAAATALFLALSGLPPLLYRLRFGTWMG